MEGRLPISDRVAFAASPAQSRGKGMRDRMVDILHSRTTEAADEMFTDVITQVDELIADLSQFLSDQAQEVIQLVTREVRTMDPLVATRASAQLDASGPRAVVKHVEYVQAEVPTYEA